MWRLATLYRETFLMAAKAKKPTAAQVRAQRQAADSSYRITLNAMGVVRAQIAIINSQEFSAQEADADRQRRALVSAMSADERRWLAILGSALTSMADHGLRG